MWAGLDFCDSIIGRLTFTFLDGAGDAAVGVVSLIVAEVASSAVAEVASSPDAEVVFSAVAEVAPSAVAGVASSAVAEVASSAVAEAMSSAVAEAVSSAVAKVASPADIVEVSSLVDSASVDTAGVAFWKEGVVLSDSVCDYDDYVYDENPDYFNYDDPEDFDSYPDVYGFIEPNDYELCHDHHRPDDCGVYCAARGETGRSPYWIGDAERDVCIRDVALPRDRIR